MIVYFDIEADGFLESVTKIHCLVFKADGLVMRYRQYDEPTHENVADGLRHLMKIHQAGATLVAHNGIKYDLAVIKKLYPWFEYNEDKVLDTLVMSRLMFPNLFEERISQKLELKIRGSHSLEAWGLRLGNPKSDYQGGWDTWSQEMEDYCEQDVHTLESLYEFFRSQDYSPRAIRLEHEVAFILARQERRGFRFDTAGAAKLYADLSKERATLERQLRDTFIPFYLRKGKDFVPKADNKKYGYVSGAGFTPVALTEFNPASRDHISNRLKTLRGWKPSQFTDDGKPKVDETVLNQLPYPEAKLLARYFMVNKRIGQIAEGEQAWLKLERGGRLHGGVITNGAVTGRMTHANPNLAQVPASYSPYGTECRSLFRPSEGMVLVGADASALELRCLAGYMAPYDGGAYINTVVNGRKEDGTEIHTVNRKALGIESRDDAKTWFYAFIYGAGNEKLGTVLGFPKGNKAVQAGKASRDKFFKNLPALGVLVDKVQAKVKTQGFLYGLDKRKLHIRSSHAALNTLLQSAGAVIMKQALVCLDGHLKGTLNLTEGVDYEFVANVHDEWQIECKPELAETIGKSCVWAMEEAGRQFGFACPITGEYRSGSSWAETH